MNPVTNPYAPGAGNPPPELAGRAEILADTETALKRVANGRPIQSPIMVGLRGVGKTVLLVRIREMAEGQGFAILDVEAHENKTLPEMLAPGLRKALYNLSVLENAKDKARRGLRVLKGFLAALKVSYGEFELGISEETGTADTGDIEADLPELLCSVGEAAKAAGRPIAIIIDELQYLSTEEFSALIMSIHKINQRGLPLLLIGAGLPQILGLAGNSKSYAERLFRYPKIGELRDEDARAALINPAKMEGVDIADDAVAEIMNVTACYPYFLQQWAHDAWNIAPGPTITKQDVQNATPIAIANLDQSFFQVRFDRCTPAEKRYMRALADLGSGQHRSGDVAERLGISTTSAAPHRSALIKKGMVYSPTYGDTAFTVPLFDAYMRRVMPKLPGKAAND